VFGFFLALLYLMIFDGALYPPLAGVPGVEVFKHGYFFGKHGFFRTLIAQITLIDANIKREDPPPAPASGG
jgi:hypothetical protein